MKSLKLILFFFLGLVIQTSWSQRNLTLKPESKYEVISEMETNTTMSMMGQDMDMKQEQNSTSILEITAEEEDLYNFTVEVVAITAKISQMGQEESYDSADEESQKGPLGVAYNDRLNDKKHFKISKQGELINPEEIEEEIAGEAFGELQQYFSFFIPLPDDIAVGKTWTDNQTVETDELNLKSDKTYTVISIDGDLITLGLKGTINMRQNMVNEGATVKTNLRGTTSGETIVDKANNIIKSDHSFTQFEGNTQASGMDIPISMKTTVKNSVKEIK
ncbi:MAG TPA: DUF6263 family protein [Flavobacteriaceae bacterium]|nr:DUF6263 family protein [Flavobacteriaceae bacterium]